jgi:lipoprotein-releasing system permease protein
LRTHFPLFLALRYLKPKRTFVSAITVISILGVTLGITVLILVISVMTGFDRELQRKVLGFDAHLVLSSDGVIEGWRERGAEAAAVPGVLATAPFVQGPVIAEFAHRRAAPKIRGIDPDEEEKITGLRRYVVEGAFDLVGESAVIGMELARNLGIAVGDKLLIYSPGNIQQIVDEIEKLEGDGEKKADVDHLRELVLPAELTVTGIFQSGRFLYDSEFILVPLHIGQELYGLGDGVHGISIRTEDPYRVGPIQRALSERLPPPFYTLSWIDLNRELFDAIRLERNVMFFILLFIIVVAAFGIMNTLITVTVQKTREIGILKALGARTGQIVWVFLAQGMVVGFFGNLSGLAMGMALVQYRNEFKDWLAQTLGIQIFPADVYQFSKIPAEVVPGDVGIICVSAFLICSLAALIPAYLASRLDPVEALRHE